MISDHTARIRNNRNNLIYWINHSTVTTFLRVKDFMSVFINKGKVIAVFLDPSKAIDLYSQLQHPH